MIAFVRRLYLRLTWLRRGALIREHATALVRRRIEEARGRRQLRETEERIRERWRVAEEELRWRRRAAEIAGRKETSRGGTSREEAS